MLSCRIGLKSSGAKLGAVRLCNMCRAIQHAYITETYRIVFMPSVFSLVEVKHFVKRVQLAAKLTLSYLTVNSTFRPTATRSNEL